MVTATDQNLMTQGRRLQEQRCRRSRQTSMGLIRVKEECETRGDRDASAGQTFRLGKSGDELTSSVNPTLWFRAAQVVSQASCCAVFALLRPIDQKAGRTVIWSCAGDLTCRRTKRRLTCAFLFGHLSVIFLLCPGGQSKIPLAKPALRLFLHGGANGPFDGIGLAPTQSCVVLYCVVLYCRTDYGLVDCSAATNMRCRADREINAIAAGR
jgi:hypothetical protein